MIRNRFTLAAGRSIAGLVLFTLFMSVRVALAQTAEIIVDELDPNTSATGDWKSSSGRDPYAGSYAYTRGTRGTFSWHPELPASGSYRVYAWWTYHPLRSEQAPYRIEHDGGVTTVRVDQHDESLAGGWQLLGTYELTPGANGTVTVSAENGSVSADAVRFVQVQAEPAVSTTSPTGGTDTVITDSGTTSGDTGTTTGDTGTTTTGTSEPVNSAPVIGGTAPASVLVDTTYRFVPDTYDPDGDPLTFAIVNKPGWAQFDSTTGALRGLPGPADVGTYNDIDIAVTDSQTIVAMEPFSIEVQEVPTRSITLNWQPPTENTDGSTLTNLAGYQVAYGTDPAALEYRIDIANEGLTSYTVDSLSPGMWYFELLAINDAGVTSDPSNLLTADLR